MSRIVIDEIEEVYKKCGITVDENKLVRTTLNMGNLDNRLNTNYVTLYKNEFNRLFSSEIREK